MKITTEFDTDSKLFKMYHDGVEVPAVDSYSVYSSYDDKDKYHMNCNYRPEKRNGSVYYSGMTANLKPTPEIQNELKKYV